MTSHPGSGPLTGAGPPRPDGVPPPPARPPGSGPVRRERPPRYVDVLTAVLAVAADAAAMIPVVFWLLVRNLERSGTDLGPGRTGPPSTDWVPTVVVAAFAVVLALTAVAFGRSRRPMTAAVQILAAGVVLLLVPSTGR